MLAFGGQCTLATVAMQLVRQPARLRTEPAIGRPPTDHRRHEALSRVAYAQSSVSERLDFHAKIRSNLRQLSDFLNREFASKRHALRAKTCSCFNSSRRMGVHLRRDVQGKLRDSTSELSGKTNILHDDTICSGSVYATRKIDGSLEFAWKYFYVHRDVNRHAPQMRILADARQRLECEVVRIATRIELVEPEIHRISSRRNRSMQTCFVPSRCQQFRLYR